VTDKKMLIVDSDLLARIDDNRGELSRTEFLYHLINNAMGEEPAEETLPDQNQYLKREEFERYTQDMRDLLKRFLDFFLYNNMAVSAGSGNGEFDDMARQLQSLSSSGARTRKSN
jgi:lipase chaperone LimK